MKILMVHNEYGAMSGEEAVFRSYVDAIKLKYDVRKYVVESSKTPVSFFDKVRSFFSGIFSIKCFFEFYSKVTSDSIDIVHFHNIYPWISVSAVVAAKLGGAKVVFTLHNFKHICPSSTLTRQGEPYFESLKYGERYTVYNNVQDDYFKSIGYYLRFKSEKLFGLSKIVDRFIHVSDAQKKIYTDYNDEWSKSIVIPNFITNEDSARYFANQKLQRKNGVPRVCFVGRLTREKGLDNFLSIAKNCTSTEFFLIGEGEVNINQNNVKVIGKLDKVDLFRTLLDMDYVISCPTTFETFSLSSLEALCCGCKVVLSNKVGLEMYKEETDRIFNVDNMSTLSDDFFYFNLEQTKTVGVPSFASQDKFLEKIVELYEGVLK
ncbi:putative glycosyltransferase protein [Vibrio cholerae]|nr:putative glycogen synthase [Vibrio cholerae]GHY51462.1 putative glycosyltransferase protein [Vibrio cholerae]